MNDNEVKAREFLKYVGENIELLKNKLKKNITLDTDIFDDSFNETIIKIYDSIVKNGTNVKDFKQYFFIASKWTYILNDNKQKKKKECEIRGLFDVEKIGFYEEGNNEEEIFERTNKALKEIKRLILTKFTQEQTEIYLEYYKIKALRKQTSYKNIAMKYNIPIKFVKETIISIREFLNNNADKINKIKMEYKDGIYQ